MTATVSAQTPERSADAFTPIEVRNPANNELIDRVPNASVADCLGAVDLAAASLPEWSATAPRVRAELLRKSFEALTERREELAELIVRENGKAFAEALAEADYAAEFFRWFAEEAVRVTGDYRLSPAGDKQIVVTDEPVGVVLLVTPWNFPAAMAARKLAPALAAGCTAVVKPAAETPLSTYFIVDVMRACGLPEEVVKVVLPDPPGEAVSAMLRHRAIRKLSFTGSTEVGRILMREASENIVGAALELGGNAPLIVLEGADLEEALAGAFAAKMRNGGSACTAANRLYVHRSLAREFAERFAAMMEHVQTGPGSDRANELGALVSLKERDKVAALVGTAISEGARLLTGGSSIEPGAFYQPTVLTGVEHGSSITRTEIFGPVAAIIEFDTLDEVVAMANDTDHGLVAYVFGELASVLRVAKRLETGMVAVNRGTIGDPAAPFGGVKHSGLGREGGFEGIREFLEPKFLAMPAFS
ncbi:NAD-dependent succinate-semialdehyde dehydrogenase [Humidisolicoccus flavus]|uniref:NAD-dependent succinate-semialdehyde dehydrogenase n=1 Tax=Humidisolicoccus flavus TaxID=3111414 RepID=UPI00324AD5D5